MLRFLFIIVVLVMAAFMIIAFIKVFDGLPIIASLESAPIVRADIKTYKIRIFNGSTRPVTIIGAERSCTCISPGDLPATIASKASLVMDVTGGSEVEFREITYFLTGAKQSKLRVVLR